MRPFDLIDGKKIDLDNDLHRKVVRRRNKDLNEAIKNGTNYYILKKHLTLELKCLKCGTLLSAETSSLEDCDPIEPSVECKPCKIRYSYDYKNKNYKLII